MLHSIFHWHSFVEVQSDDFSILIDPFITWNSKCDISLADLKNKNIKAIIVTHWHSDHIWDTITIAENHPETKIIWMLELVQYLNVEKWVSNIHAMNLWWEHNFWDFSIKLTTALHSGSINEMWNWFYTNPCWVIVRIWWKSIYHAWDTALTLDMKLLWDHDKIDVAFLPIWDNFTMWIKDAVIATSYIKPRIVVPTHYDTWELISADALEFAKLVMLENHATPKVLNPWQFIVL